MKRIFLHAIIVMVAILSFGCGKKTTENVETVDKSRIENIQDTVNVFDVTLEKSEEEHQSYWNVFNHHMAKGSGGYYFYQYGYTYDKLLFWDEGTKELITLCNKAECAHNNSACDAAFDKSYVPGVWYYKDALYFVKKSSNNIVLVTAQKDGSNRKELFEIGNGIIINKNSTSLTFLDDNVYIYDRVGNMIWNEAADIGIRK